MTEKLSDLLPELGIIRAIVSEERLKDLAALDASDQIVNSKSDLAAMVRTLTMQRDQAREEVGRGKKGAEEALAFLCERDALRAEIVRLREALEVIATLDPLTQGDIAVRRAKKALTG